MSKLLEQGGILPRGSQVAATFSIKALNMLAILVYIDEYFYSNFIMLSVVTLFVLMPSVVMLGADRLSVIVMGAFSKVPSRCVPLG
jgi:hypothetical protein